LTERFYPKPKILFGHSLLDTFADEIQICFGRQRRFGFCSSPFPALPATLHWRYGGGQDANISSSYASAVVPADG
jgi:hypothetical protein